jgi:hypothetical protein
MANKEEIKKVLNYIEENMRVTEQTSIEYLDSQGHIDRLCLKQNHIIFGRRGSGKSLLLKSLKEQKQAFCITVNLEDFKDISFPNSIIQVQKSIIKQLLPILKAENNFFSFDYWKTSRFLIKRLNKQITSLNKQLEHPDEYDESVKQKKGGKKYGKGKAKTGGNEVETGAETSEEIETSKEIKIDKLNSLKNGLSDIKELFTNVSKGINKDLFLILDDFYFIRKNEQPYFLDFFHRLSKNTPLYLKVATIKHRTRLYTQDESYIGIELPHDAQALNLDYSFEDFNSLVSFMKNLLLHINKKVNVSIKYEDFITDNAFRFLCLASGGVPRDFFSLLVSLGPMLGEEKSISKPNVIDKAIENISNKMETFRTDTAEEGRILQDYLKFIQNTIINEKKWNAFLVSNVDVQNHPHIHQAIKELADLRFLHLVNPNISSASSDGTRYSAYLIDIGLFPNANPRKFQQVEPGQKDEKSREDKIRSAPKLNLYDFKKYITNQKQGTEIEITE